MESIATKLINQVSDVLSRQGDQSLRSLLNYKTNHGHKRLYFSNAEYEFLGLYSPESKGITKENLVDFLANGHVVFTMLPFDEAHPWQRWELPPYLLCDYTFIREIQTNELRIQCNSERPIEFIPKEVSTSQIIATSEKPNFEHWEKFVNSGLALLKDRTHPLTKFVAARTRELKYDKAPNTAQIFNDLNSSSIYHFFVESNNLTFMGNTPECLLAGKGDFYRFDALAGTRPRGKTHEEDQALESELLSSPKERDEHHQVVSYITHGLDQLGQVSQGESFVLKLKSLQHIKTPLTLKSKDHGPQVLLDLIDRLHPTPAVCGMPRNEAMNFLRLHDPIDRGMYAGAIGILSRDYSELCVGIRSLLIDHNNTKAILYGGAGIVADSDPEAEWEETGHKMNSFSPFGEVAR